MDANEYQRLASLTAAPQNDADRAANAVLGLAGEAGELAQLLILGGWHGSEQVRRALDVIAALGTLVEPVKKVIYQGHEPPYLGDWAESFDLLKEGAGAWERWCYGTQRVNANLWAQTPATARLDAMHREFADELGDAQWYVAQGARAIGWDLGIVMQGNLQKLERRFPGRVFSAAASQDRALEYGEGQGALGSSEVAAPAGPAYKLPPVTGLHLVPSLNGEMFDLVWDPAGFPYAVEQEHTTHVFCGSGSRSGSWMRTRHPYRLRVRLQDGALFGPWSEWVTITPQVPVTITDVVAIVIPGDGRTVRVDTVWPALPETALEWEDNAIYTGYWTPTSDWLLPRRWHDYQVRFRWRPDGLPHGEWSEWFTVPARPIPDVRGLRVEAAPNPAPDSDTLAYARLVWDNRDLEIGYQVEFLGSGNIYCLNDAGTVATAAAAQQVRVRAALADRTGPWSDAVTLPADPLLAPAPVLRLVTISAEPEPGGRPSRLVSLAWDGGVGDGNYVVELSNDPAFAPAPYISLASATAHPAAESRSTFAPVTQRTATVKIVWESTPYIRVHDMDTGRISNVIHVPPAPPLDPPPAPCAHSDVEIIGSFERKGAQKLHGRCAACGAEVVLDDDDDRAENWAAANAERYREAVIAFAAEADQLVEAQRRIRAAQSRATTAMHWIITRDWPTTYATELAAIEEAERLARKEGSVFQVWQMVGKVEAYDRPVRWVPASDLPF